MEHAPQLLRSAPYFPVGDLEHAAEHYERVLGFHRDYVGGSPPHFAILSRDGLPPTKATGRFSVNDFLIFGPYPADPPKSV